MTTLQTVSPAVPAASNPFPRPTRHGTERSPRMLPAHAAIQTRRLLLRWSRDPMTVVQSLLFPALLLFMLDTVLGKQISTFSGYSALYGSVPMTALVGVMSGAIAGAVTLGRERDGGLLARFWVLPVHRASGMLSRILADAVRIVVTTAVIIAVGVALGFRFEQGLFAGLAFVAVPLLYGLAFATMVTAVAVWSAKQTLVETISLGSSLMMFFSTGFVPLAAYPKWAQPIVEHQPMSYAIDAMRGLSLGGAVRTPLLATVAWSAALIVVFAVPAALGYRRASRG